MTPVVTNPLTQPGNRPLLTATRITVSESTLADIRHFSDLVYTLGEEVVRLYYAGNADVAAYVNHGLPSACAALLDVSRNIPPHRLLLRFDFFFTDAGPKLVEISSNPWGLLSYQRHNENSGGSERFEAIPIYVDLCNARLGGHGNSPRVGFWKDFGVYDEVTELIEELRQREIAAEWIAYDSRLDDYAVIFFDVDTAYFGGTLSALLPYAAKLLPSPTNEIIKRKNFLALMYSYVDNAVPIPSVLTTADKEFMRRFLVPTHLVPDQLPTVISSGAIKDVVGIWGLQVTILSPSTAAAEGPHARHRRQAFRKHLREASMKRNAILQEYIPPLSLASAPDLFTEFSLVYGRLGASPFARVYKGAPETKGNVGLGLVDVQSFGPSIEGG